MHTYCNSCYQKFKKKNSNLFPYEQEPTQSEATGSGNQLEFFEERYAKRKSEKFSKKNKQKG